MGPERLVHLRWSALLSAVLLVAGCGGPADEAAAADPPAAADLSADAPADRPDGSAQASVDDVLGPDGGSLDVFALPAAHGGDLDEMVRRRVIRVLTVYSRGYYFLDGPEARGVIPEAARVLERFVNERVGAKPVPVRVLIVPVPRDLLLQALADGHGDIAAANLTITPERERLVDFAEPWSDQVNEVVVTGPSASPLASLDDLGGQTVYVRRSSSYYESLMAFNERQAARGAPLVNVVDAAEHLEDDDLLEMVNAGLLPMTVVDSHIAGLWSQVFDDLTVRSDLQLRTGSRIAWAVRKGTPELRALLGPFVRANGPGTLTGNVVINRYLRDTRWVRNAAAPGDEGRFADMADLFRRYGERFEFDWRLLAAQGYQESRLDQSARSRAGAVGVMQLLPSTAADPNVNVGSIEVLENNIHAGAKYLRFLRDRYFDDADLDVFNASLFALAAYNAGPARLARLRAEAAEVGLNANQWFRNVELVAARRVGQEPVQYVANIYKYYVAYRLLSEQRRRAVASSGTP